jgi:aminoglycoside phosphotransferase (APT) family kinase protein
LGSARVVELRPVLGGASALAYRVETDQRPVLLRVESSHGAPRSAEHYVCMQMAADAGIAPALRHVDAERGVAIMDFVTQRPLQEYPGGASALCTDLGRLVRKLQESTAFPAPRTGYLDLVGRMLGAVHGSRVFSAGLLDPHLAGFQRIRDAYPWDDSAHVSSHNDPNPRNVLFDGERLWLIDWETSGRNDRFADVAVLSHELAATPELQDVLLRNALGREPDRATRARLQLMRQVTRLYFACVILRGFASRAEPDPDLAALTPGEFVSAIQTGRLRIGTPELLYAWGKMFLAAFRAGLVAPDFEAALEVVASRN